MNRPQHTSTRHVRTNSVGWGFISRRFFVPITFVFGGSKPPPYKYFLYLIQFWDAMFARKPLTLGDSPYIWGDVCEADRGGGASAGGAVRRRRGRTVGAIHELPATYVNTPCSHQLGRGRRPRRPVTYINTLCSHTLSANPLHISRQTPHKSASRTQRRNRRYRKIFRDCSAKTTRDLLCRYSILSRAYRSPTTQQ